MDHDQTHWTHLDFASSASAVNRQRLDGTSGMALFETTPASSNFNFFPPATTAGSAAPSAALSMSGYADERGLGSTGFSGPMAPPPLGTETIVSPAPFLRAAPGTTAKNRRWQPPDVDWDRHKNSIFELYITRNQTLVETMRQMEQHHGFRASQKMYKERLRDWKFAKNLKRHKVVHITRETAKRQGKVTEVLVGGHPIPMSRVQRSMGRQMAQTDVILDAPTPASMSDVVVRAPANDAPTPRELHKSSEQPRIPSEEMSWSPSYSAAILDDDVADSSRANWMEASVSKLRQLKLHAIRSDGGGDFAKAEHEFRDALRGFRRRFGLTDPQTTKTAYQLASFFAKRSRTGEAYKVLQWALDSHVEKWTLEHPMTVKYLIQVVELHQAWANYENAAILLHRILPLLQKLSVKYFANEALVSRDEEPGPESWDDDGIHVAGEKGLPVEVQVDTHLGIVDAWLDFGMTSFNPLLSRFIHHCKSFPERLSLQKFQAQLLLIKDFVVRGKFDEGLAELRLARQSMVKLFSNADDPPPKDLLSASRALAFIHLEFDDIKGDCEKILSWVADRLESRLSILACKSFGMGTAALGYLALTFQEYQNQHGYEWSDVGHWLERAYGLAVRVTGAGSKLSISLEESLRHRVLRLEDEEPAPETSLESKMLLMSLTTGN